MYVCVRECVNIVSIDLHCVWGVRGEVCECVSVCILYQLDLACMCVCECECVGVWRGGERESFHTY